MSEERVHGYTRLEWARKIGWDKACEQINTFVIEVGDSSVASPTPDDHQGSIMSLPNGQMLDVLEVIDGTHVRVRERV